MSTKIMVQVAWFDVTITGNLEDPRGRIETWAINSYQDIDQAIVRYVDEANEHEDQELSDIEIKRLIDFATFLKNTTN